MLLLSCLGLQYAIFLRFDVGNRQSPQSKLPFNILQVQLLQLPTYFHLSWFFQPSTSGQHLQTSDIWMDLRDYLSRKSLDANGKMCMSHYVHFFDAWISRSLLICSYICTIDACLEMTPISDFPLPIHPVPFWSCDSIIMLWRLIAFLWHVSLDVSGPCKRCRVPLSNPLGFKHHPLDAGMIMYYDISWVTLRVTRQKNQPLKKLSRSYSNK